MQSFIFICLLLWSFLDPNENLWLIVAIGLGIAISSATQDITIDALRIEQIGENEKDLLAAGAAISVVGWWTGYKIGGLISLVSADYLQKNDFENYWQISFLILSLVGVRGKHVRHRRKTVEDIQLAAAHTRNTQIFCQNL